MEQIFLPGGSLLHKSANCQNYDQKSVYSDVICQVPIFVLPKDFSLLCLCHKMHSVVTDVFHVHLPVYKYINMQLPNRFYTE